MPPLLK